MQPFVILPRPLLECCVAGRGKVGCRREGSAAKRCWCRTCRASIDGRTWASLNTWTCCQSCSTDRERPTCTSAAHHQSRAVPLTLVHYSTPHAELDCLEHGVVKYPYRSRNSGKNGVASFPPGVSWWWWKDVVSGWVLNVTGRAPIMSKTAWSCLLRTGWGWSKDNQLNKSWKWCW